MPCAGHKIFRLTTLFLLSYIWGVGVGTTNAHPLHWRSNKQPKTSLSSAEAEVYAMMEAVQDGVLRMRVAEDAGLEVRWPMTLSVDNAAGESFCNKTTPQSMLRGVFNMKDQRIKETTLVALTKIARSIPDKTLRSKF